MEKCEGEGTRGTEIGTTVKPRLLGAPSQGEEPVLKMKFTTMPSSSSDMEEKKGVK